MYTKLRPSSYEEFQSSFSLSIPERYNFAFDMVDAAAAQDPGRLAMVHVDDADVRREYTFGYFSEQSARLAHAFHAVGHSFFICALGKMSGRMDRAHGNQLISIIYFL